MTPREVVDAALVDKLREMEAKWTADIQRLTIQRAELVNRRNEVKAKLDLIDAQLTSLNDELVVIANRLGRA